MAKNPIREGHLYALEKNILKYRALEMVLVLFYIEDLKSFILHSIDASDRVMQRPRRLPEGTKNPLQKAFKILVEDGVITQAESDEIQNLINYRNEIGHKIQNLTVDVGSSQIAQDMRNHQGVKYDYKARKKLKRFREDLPRRMQGKYVLSASIKGVMFEAAEITYEQELNRLWKRIEKQIPVRMKAYGNYVTACAAESRGMMLKAQSMITRLTKLSKKTTED